MAYTILLVDDDAASLNAYFHTLLRIGNTSAWGGGGLQDGVIRVLKARTYAEAMEHLVSNDVDVLVADLKISGPTGELMGGLNLISESRSLDRFRTNIVLTGFGTMDLMQETYQRGIFDFVEKSPGSDQRLVEAVRSALVAREERLVREGNPFNPTSGTEPAFFGGRDAELEFFEQALHHARDGRAKHFVVVGDWGVGKSTLLKEYRKLCQRWGRLAAVVPLEALEAGSGTGGAVRSLVEGIVRELPLPAGRLKKLTTYFETVGINILGSGFQVTRNSKGPELRPQAFLHDSLLRLWEDLHEITDAVVILIDDLDNFAQVPEFVTTLKQTLSMESLRPARFLFGFTATPGNWNTLVASERTHPLARFYDLVELTLLAPSDFHETVEKSLAKGGVRFVPEVIERAYRYTRGHPYEMQLLCHHLFANQISRQVTLDVWEQALKKTLADMGLTIFRYWLMNLTQEQARILRILAEVDGPVSGRQIRALIAERKVGVDPRKVASSLRHLEERSFVRRIALDTFEMHDLMFGAYLRNQTFL